MTKLDEILDELESQIMDPHNRIFYEDLEREEILKNYTNAVKALYNSDNEGAVNAFYDIAHLKLKKYLSLTVLFNEISFIKDKLAHDILLKKDAQKLFELFELFNKIENGIAKIFLTSYTKELKSKNALRLRAIEIFKEKKIIKYYEQHLLWLDTLADAIYDLDPTAFPRLDSALCEFGVWLQNEGKLILSNNSQFKTLNSTHKKLHNYASRIQSQLATKGEVEYLYILSMLQKCEYISVDIGIELSFIKSSEYMEKAQYDALTGVLNRHYLDEIYENEFKLSRVTEKKFCIAMCDLDHFKNINDTYGHSVGDSVLKAFTTFLKSHVRATDHIIRYGGEEFVIIFPSTSLENGVAFLERLKINLNALEVTSQDKIIKITSSFGIIEIDPAKKDKYAFSIEDGLRRVDEKLYTAKENGRNRIEF
jgi:diguanylate cyclase (GGDEF)-like protein